MYEFANQMVDLYPNWEHIWRWRFGLVTVPRAIALTDGCPLHYLLFYALLLLDV